MTDQFFFETSVLAKLYAAYLLKKFYWTKVFSSFIWKCKSSPPIHNKILKAVILAHGNLKNLQYMTYSVKYKIKYQLFYMYYITCKKKTNS